MKIKNQSKRKSSLEGLSNSYVKCRSKSCYYPGEGQVSRQKEQHVQKPWGRSGAGADRPRQRVVEMKSALLHSSCTRQSPQEPVGKLKLLPVHLKFKVQGLRGRGEHLQKLHQRHAGTLKARCATISWSHSTNSDAVTRHVCDQAGGDFLSADSSQGLSTSRFQAPGDIGPGVQVASGTGHEPSQPGDKICTQLEFQRAHFSAGVSGTVSLNAARRVLWFINFQTLGKGNYCLDF